MTARPRGSRRPFANVGALLDWATARLARARLHYGHGTDNPRDDAAALVFHALGLAHESAPASYLLPVTARQAGRAARLVERRVRERMPSAYLTGVSWFAGHAIRVTPDVLVPRSPIAELCRAGFAPWVKPSRIGRVLDIGTGSGCIAIAAAHALPRARVDASDVSAAALAVARGNVRRHRLGRRVRILRADVYDGLPARRYDVIVSNPPYVTREEFQDLPDEVRADSELALVGGMRPGCDCRLRGSGGGESDRYAGCGKNQPSADKSDGAATGTEHGRLLYGSTSNYIVRYRTTYKPFYASGLFRPTASGARAAPGPGP